MKKLMPLSSIINSLHDRLSLTMKMTFFAGIIGLFMWLAFDQVQTYKLKSIFQGRMNDRLSEQALEDRLRFDRYVKAHLHSIKLFISQKNFGDYIDKSTWQDNKSSEVVIHGKTPLWFPKPSVLRTFIQPRFALLLDSQGKVREVYKSHRNEAIPSFIINPSKLLLYKSLGQNFIDSIDSKTYLIASDHHRNSKGEIQAILMLVSPIDDIFLMNVLGTSTTSHIIALLSPDDEARIQTSSNLNEMPEGTPLSKLLEEYMVTGQEYFDYGAAEQEIRFVSFISLAEVESLVESITSSERQLRIIGMPVLIGSLVLLMFWVTGRIQRLTVRISDFSEKMLGVRPRELQRGDQISRLEERFHNLTEEVLSARDVIKREAEEKLRLEKKNIEITQKEKQLRLLQSVTQAVGVGVIKRTGEGLVAVNKKMEEFAETCGGLESFDMGDIEESECSIPDCTGNERIFSIRNPDIFKEEKIYLVRDITKYKEQTEALEHMAMHDALTGLPNRALLRDRLQQAIFTGQREGNSLALLMMDLDRFKEINDTLGHHVGDMVLKEVAFRLPGVLRKSDTFARLGGDEFAVVLPSTDKDHAEDAARKLLSSLEVPINIDGHHLYVGGSIGIVFYPEHGKDASVLLQRADVAMYVAKNAQTGLSVYSPDHDQHSIRSLVLMGALRNAIANDGLSVHYQPKISYKSGRIQGVEALVRWKHPEHGFIAPDDFIPMAEQTGLIKPLTMQVLDKSLQQNIKWAREAGNMINVSVNLSAKSLLDSRFPEELSYLLEKRGVDPGWLEFEITESAVMADPELALKTLIELDHLGVRLSIDDFGTGYSSLSYLKKLPVDEIKIDKSFVINMTHDENDEMIVRSTIDLAHNLGLWVIAEGVETCEVLDALELLGCDGAQGYHICRPLPAVELIDWVSNSPWEFESSENIFQP